MNPNSPLSNFDDVGMFHRRFGLTSVSHEGVGPREPEEEVMDFRARFMQEELDEFNEAREDGDEAKMFDALLDLVYVALGTAHLRGYPWPAGWELVQQANMAKVRATDPEQSARGGIWDVIKPVDWEAPDIEGLLFNSGWTAEVGENAHLNFGVQYARVSRASDAIAGSVIPRNTITAESITMGSFSGRMVEEATETVAYEIAPDLMRYSEVPMSTEDSE